MESWRPCENYEGSYEVSNYGNVRSLNRNVEYLDGRIRAYIGQELKQSMDKYGYMNVYLSKNGSDKRTRVHRLVAYAFIFNEHELPEVNHKDGDKSNNYWENLEWVSSSGNISHAIEMGLSIKPSGTKAYRFTGAVHAFDKDGKLIAIMHGNREMAEYGFDYRLVSAVLKGKRKTHKGCTFIKMDKENA